MEALIGLVIVGLVATVVIIVVQRMMKRGDQQSNGADIVAYLVLALAMGVAGFALAELASTAFPGDRFVFDPADNLATSLSALVVSVPFVIYFWRRQADRREQFPRSPGWTLYLTLMEVVFTTAFVVSTVIFLSGLLGEGNAAAWTGTLVFGAIVLFHELAALRTPPQSDAHDLPRVVGSAIGLIALTIGLGGTLTALFDQVTNTMDFVEFDPFLAMLIVGAPVWAYRWLRPWHSEPGVPRLTWLVIVACSAALLTVGAATALVVAVLQYMLANTPEARDHFEFVPVMLAALITGLAVWIIHRRSLGTERRNSVRMYEYVLAAAGLVASVTSAIGLTLIALDQALVVGGGVSDVIAVTVPLIVGLVVWRYFTTRSWRGDTEVEAVTWPRRLYHLGVGIVFALVALGSLITALFVLLRRFLGDGATGSLLEPTTVLVYTALAAWYLLAAYARDREVTADEEVVSPFRVTVICSHPGLLATRFPKQAEVRVIYRGDDSGTVDVEMADAIVAEVASRSSLVWVDDDGFRVAPQLES